MKYEYNKPDRKELRNFGFVTGGITAVLFGLGLPWLFDHSFPKWPWIVAGTLFVCSLAFPVVLGPVHRVWMAIGNVLGWINTRIIIAIMFYLLIVPIGLIMKIFGKDPLLRRIDPDAESYRVISSVRDNKHMERPF